MCFPRRLLAAAGLAAAAALPARGDAPRLAELFVLEGGHTGGIHRVAWLPDGRGALTAGEDGAIVVWDVDARKVARKQTGHAGAAYDLVVSADGRRALSGGYDKTLRLWDVESGKPLAKLEGHADNVFSVALSPDGKLALSASRDGTVRVWDLAGGKEARRLEHPACCVWSLTFSPDGRTALTASGGKYVERRWEWGWEHNLARTWDVATGKESVRLQGSFSVIRSAAWSPDGKQALTGETGMLRLWDAATGRELRRMRTPAHVWSVAFLPGGKRALTGELQDAEGDGMTVRLWDLGAGTLVAVAQGYSLGINRVAVSPDGKRALTASVDGKLRVYRLPE